MRAANLPQLGPTQAEETGEVRDFTTRVAVVFTMIENDLPDREYIEARRLEGLEDRLVSEGKALCGLCHEPIRFHRGHQMWVDDRDRHHCRGTTFNHFPRNLSGFSLMSEDRPPIPRPLERELFIEAGYRCAIPTCRAVAPLQIDHIEDWVKVQEHRFENMIVLCSNCHGRKGSKRGQIDRLALRQYKANLALLNHRYGEFERRVLDYFAMNPTPSLIFLPGGMDLLVYYLVSDGYLACMNSESIGRSVYILKHDDGAESTIGVPSELVYGLTESGRKFLHNWQEAKPLDASVDLD